MTPRLSRLLRPAGVEESIGLVVLSFALLLALAHAVFAEDLTASAHQSNRHATWSEAAPSRPPGR